MSEYDWQHPDPSEVARWAEAASLDDLGTLTAEWISGDLSFHPSYAAYGLANESSEIASVLVEFNRSGLVTTGSQPGVERDKAGSAQRAYLDAMCTGALAAKVSASLNDTDLVLLSFAPGAYGEGSLVVTLDVGEEFTFHGRNYPDEEASIWEQCVGASVAALVSEAWVLQIVDPVWGRNDRLWPAITEALR